MPEIDRAVPSKPSRWVAAVASAAVLLLWAFLRFAVVQRVYFPLTYALPLFVCVWTRNRPLLWLMAAGSAGLVFAEAFWTVPPQAFVEGQRAAMVGASLANIGLGALVVHFMIATATRLEAAVAAARTTRDDALSGKDELHAQAEELQAQAEELASQNEEMQAQREELEAQAEELRAQSDEVGALNRDLASREKTLQGLLEATRAVDAERHVLARLCDSALEMVCGEAAAVAVIERAPDGLILPGAACRGRTTHPPSVDPVEDSFAKLVMEQGRTAALDDASLRPDVRLLRLEDCGPFGAALASPIRIAGAVVGVLAVYTRAPHRWCAEEFRVTEWLAAEGSLALETARLNAETRRQAALIDLSPDAIFGRKTDGTITLWGHGAEVLYGYSRDEALGQSSHSLLRTVFPGPLAEIEWELEAKGRWSGELVHTTKAGEAVVVESRWLAQRDAQGTIVELLESNVDISERKQMELALATSEHRLAVIVDSIADGFFAFDREIRITHANDAALRHFGKNRKELVGHDIFEVFPAARGGQVEAEYRAALRTGEPRHFEARSLLSDKVLEFHVYPGPDSVTVLFRDITERSRLAAALQEAHDRAVWLARFPDENPNPVARIAADGRVLYRNLPAATLPGWTLEAGATLPVALLTLVRDAMEHGQEVDRDLELAGRSYSVSVAPFMKEGYANIYGRDVTERKRLEAALRDGEAALRGIFNATKESIWMFGLDGAILAANDIAVTRLGRPKEAILGKRFHEVLPNELAASRRARLRQTIETRQRVEFEDERAGMIFHHTFAPILGPEGEVTAVVSFSRDITERRRTELAIEASLREKEILLKEIHHRVKNNLQIIASLLQLQAGSMESEADRAPLIESQARVRTMALIHEKLYGSKDLSTIPFHEYLADLSHGLIASMRTGLITVKLEVEEVHLGITVAIPLALVTNELLSNSLKHAFPAGRTGTVVVGLRAAGNGRYELRVADDGVGIPPGIDIHSSESLGLQIISILTTQIGATVTICRQVGTQVLISFADAA